MIDNGMIYFAKKGPEERPDQKIYLNPAMANRHGFIGGATGTGKSVTLKVLAESFSQLGVPTFFSDVKGDMAGIAVPGEDNEGMQKRLDRFDIRDQFEYRGFPVTIYDIYGEKGIPLRTTVTEMGPQLMSQILDLNDTQTDLLTVSYKIADDLQMLLVDTKDLKAMLTYVSENADQFETEYGHITKTSMATIIRSIVALEAEGADRFFGEPAINITDFFTLGPDGRGMVNILDAETLISKPKLYSAFMLYLLSELFEVLPEVGDIEKPKMVFFFDEAHLLFNNATKALLEKIIQVVKLIRSKGIGLFFITQSPGDIPSAVMAQLGNKIEHGLHAYTPAEQKVVKAAADSFRENPEFNTEDVLKNLGTGEAVVSVLDEKGAPSIAEYAYILPPESSMSAISDETRDRLIKESLLYTKYGTMVDPDSAYEVIGRMKAKVEEEQTQAAAEAAQQAQADKEAKAAEKEAAKAEKKKQNELDKIRKRVASTTGSSVGREVGKAVGEAVFGKKGRTIFGNIGSTLGRNILGTLTKIDRD
ncbi:MAG: DUF853 family protein [Firmicutes bacterium]|nr:DUF853 family protein [Bacillota bacterium]